jgi:hypothetical protein
VFTLLNVLDVEDYFRRRLVPNDPAAEQERTVKFHARPSLGGKLTQVSSNDADEANERRFRRSSAAPRDEFQARAKRVPAVDVIDSAGFGGRRAGEIFLRGQSGAAQ